MSDAYIEQHDGVYIVSGSRVSLDSKWARGVAAEFLVRAVSGANAARLPAGA